MKSMARPSNLFTTVRWMVNPRITVKLDGHHPTDASHHQKIVVLDDCFAFCGGIDMTGDRWDTRPDRKSCVEGQRVEVRGDRGERRTIKKKKSIHNPTTQ